MRRVTRRVCGTRRSRVLLGVALLMIGTHRLWLPAIGGFLVVADPIQPADALVPLAGDPARVPYASELFRQGYANWFVATSMQIDDGAQPPFAVSVKRTAVQHGVPAQQILIVPGAAATTYEEGLLLSAFAREHGWHSLIVVTSPSHTRRARLILREIFANTGIVIMIQPVQPHPYHVDRWWMSVATIRETWLEYGKLGLYWLGYHTHERRLTPASTPIRRSNVV